MLAEMCLALALYHEARGEPSTGQMMVAKVIVNRMESKKFPSDMCGVIMQPRQFSFVRKGLVPVPKDEEAWKISKTLAQEIMDDPSVLPSTSADHYHTTKVRPVWRKSLHRIVRIGKHVFYSYDPPKNLTVSLRPKIRKR
jgi:N-acetylmuramoyl-L-alanine amidase